MHQHPGVHWAILHARMDRIARRKGAVSVLCTISYCVCSDWPGFVHVARREHTKERSMVHFVKPSDNYLFPGTDQMGCHALQEYNCKQINGAWNIAASRGYILVPLSVWPGHIDIDYICVVRCEARLYRALPKGEHFEEDSSCPSRQYVGKIPRSAIRGSHMLTV
jgi:hypothetical protein